VIAVDTNVVVRLLTGDEPAQARRARELFDGGTVFIAKTVLLETEWVLRYSYRFPPDRILTALAGLAALPNVQIEDAVAVADALQWCSRGIDLADALHCASARDASAFASFDRKLVKRAPSIIPLNVVTV
jgi:predicted nucleic-acid-binding protein